MKSKDKKYGIMIGIIVLLCIIIIAVVVAWGLGYIRFGKVDNSNNKSMNQLNKTNDKDIYANYENFLWSDKYTKIEPYENWKYEIKNSKLYLTRNGKTSIIKSIVGTPKYFTATIYGGTIGKLIVMTEEEDIWVISYGEEGINDNTNGDSFSKLPLSAKIKDMTLGMENYWFENKMFYLTEDGRLINEKGIEWKTIHADHIDWIGYPGSGISVAISPDNSLSYYKEEQIEPIKIKDKNGNLVKANLLILAGNSNLGGTGDFERVFVITHDNKLLYFDESTKMVAKEYRGTANTTITSYECKRVSNSTGTTYDVVIKLSNNQEIKFNNTDEPYKIL
ncbi:MAG: hypothetical protein RSA10_03620 [Bacilli bacterium]